MPEPFHHVGKYVGSATTTRQAIEMAGLDWKTEKAPIEVAVPLAENGLTVNQNLGEMEAVVRSSDRKILGVVNSNYHLFQNDNVFQFLDNIIAKGYLRMVRAGTFREDKILWLMLEQPQPVLLKHDECEHTIRKYLLVTMTHDRNSSVTFHLLPTREDDSALLNFLGLGPEAKLVHKVHDTRELRRGLDAYVHTATKYAELSRLLAVLAENRATPSRVEKWIKAVWGDQEDYKARMTEVFKLFRKERFEGSALAVVAAMCQHVDSRLEGHEVEQWAGEGPKSKQHAFLHLTDWI